MIPESFARKFFDDSTIKLWKTNEMTSLSFGKKTILRSLEDVKIVAEIVEKNDSITELYLYYIELGDEECKLLGEAIRHSVGLKKGRGVFIVPNNVVSPRGWNALMTNSPTYLQLTTDISLEYMTFLAKELETNANVKSLTLDRNSIGNDACRILAKGIAKSKGITYLELTCNSCFSDDGWKELVLSLPNCVNLSSLSIYLHQHTVAFKAFLDVLPTLSLVHLNLSNFFLKPDELKNLLTALKECKRLSFLNLSEVKLEDTGAFILASVLSNFLSLSDLRLRDNHFGFEGIKALAIALPKLPYLRRLALANNKIEDEGLQALINILPMKR